MDNNSSGQPNGTLILVLGILSIVICGFLGPVAWVMGNNGMTLLNSGQGDESQRGSVNAGRICGIIGTVFLILGVIWIIINIGVVTAMMASGGAQAPK